MTATDWARNTMHDVRRDGIAGVVEAGRELSWGLRRRCRRAHSLFPGTFRLTTDETTIRLRQQTVGEFDQRRNLYIERDILREWAIRVRPGDTVWDVGSNVGAYALIAAQQGAEAVAFEPVPANQQAIRANAVLNDAVVTVDSRALSDSQGQEILTLDDRGVAGGGKGSLTDEMATGIEIPVDVAAGDNIDRPDPDIVKIDVEGAELSTVQGMSERLRESRTVFVELHSHDDAAVKRALIEFGFDVASPFAEKPEIIVATRQERAARDRK
ncbi:FkbM family methyltransferase [Haloarcula amylovorans]|uniref:FkbM family methyltransferase n=1 Tax=Haloarcula amylovorans TaxID=2562280 RepID=UPI0010764AE4|nr:FkbM family methyltransferase [Halomicroarcula amylolytica]